jgi:predicted phosphatase
MQYSLIPVDIESVRAQLCNELDRSVTDLDVIAWLRRCGCVQRHGRWVVQTPPVSVLRAADPQHTFHISA